ncbi:hypothetical protein Trydic_g19942 [Trypoxylus dichotomus]
MVQEGSSTTGFPEEERVSSVHLEYLYQNSVYSRDQFVEEETVKKIVKAACVLHNFIRIREGKFTNPMHIEENILNHPQINEVQDGYRETTLATKLRSWLAKYFMTSEGSIPIQWKYA